MFCRHKLQTTPRRDEAGEYRRCLDCGTRIRWSLPDGPEFHPQITQMTQMENARRTTAFSSPSAKSVQSADCLELERMMR